MADELEQPGEPQEPLGEAKPEKNERFKWYILHAYSGFERKVKESIESRIQAFGLTDRVGRVMIPTEPVTEILNCKKRTIDRVFLAGDGDPQRQKSRDRSRVSSRLRACGDEARQPSLARVEGHTQGDGFSGHGRQAGSAERRRSEFDSLPQRDGEGQAAAQDQV